MKSYLEIVFSIDFRIKHLPVRTGSKIDLRKMNSGSKVGPSQMKKWIESRFQQDFIFSDFCPKNHVSQMDQKWVDDEK